MAHKPNKTQKLTDDELKLIKEYESHINNTVRIGYLGGSISVNLNESITQGIAYELELKYSRMWPKVKVHLGDQRTIPHIFLDDTSRGDNHYSKWQQQKNH